MRTAALIVLLLAGSNVWAQAKADPETLMCERGKLLFSDDLTKPLASSWKQPKGKWQISDAGLRGAEVAADMHAAVVRHDVKFDSAVIQLQFKLDGANAASLSINGAKGHICRVRLNPDSFAIQKDPDKDGKTVVNKAVVLDTVKTPLADAAWHTLVLELSGKEMLARIGANDTFAAAFGAHDGLNVGKTNLGLTVTGDSILFKDLRVWEGTSKAGWAERRATLEQGRKNK